MCHGDVSLTNNFLRCIIIVLTIWRFIMGREARYNTVGNAFHVLVRSADDTKCFDSSNGVSMYISCLDRAQKKYGVSILAYCIMHDHAHILIVSEDGGADKLSAVMTYANAQYAKWFNANRQHEGKVFKDRFKAESLDSSQAIAECVKFIHSDPLRMEIVDSVDNYQASSCYEYLMKKGIVDFELSTRFFNPSPSAIRSSVLNLKSSNYMDTELKRSESEDEIFGYVIEKYKIRTEDDLKNAELLKAIATEIISLTGMSIRELALKLGVNREKLRRVLKS